MTTFASRPLRRATVLAAGIVATAASAFTFITDSHTSLPIKWNAGTVPIRIMLGDSKTLIDGSTYNSSARTAAEIWNARIGSVQLSSAFGTGTAGDNNGTNELSFAADVFGRAFGENVLAVTTTWSRGSGTNQRIEGDVVFNTAYTWDSYRGGVRQGSVDLQRVAIHELGHLLGLDHPDEATPKQNVSAIMNSRVGALDTLATDDIDGAQAMYGPPGVPPNNNFASATAIDLANGQLTVNGYNTNATKESGEPDHLSSGGHSVWWRWRAPSAGTVDIDTRGSYFDTALAVYTGSTLSSLASVAANDDITSGVVQASKVSFAVTGNQTYQIAVDGFRNASETEADSGGIVLNLLYTAASGSVPTILTQPVGVTVTAGGSASFSVTASGSEPLSYQWLFNGTSIAGATNATYSISNVQAVNDGTYSVTVTNAAGSVTSNNVALSVRASTPTTPTTPTTPSGGGGGGGGGGAPSIWFVLGLGAAGLVRKLASRR